MSGIRESLYQIEVLDFSRSKNSFYHSEDVVTKGKTKLKVIDTEPQGCETHSIQAF